MKSFCSRSYFLNANNNNNDNDNMFNDVLEVQKAYHKFRKTYHKDNGQIIKNYVIIVLMATQQILNSAKRIIKKRITF